MSRNLFQCQFQTEMSKTILAGLVVAGVWLQGCDRNSADLSAGAGADGAGADGAGADGAGQVSGPVTPTPGNCDRFSDVPADHWANQYIQASVEMGITAGYTLENCVDGVAEFRPDAPVTRAEYAALLSQVFPTAQVTEASPFPDVADTHWATASIQDAAAKGFITGHDDGLFRPDQPISRSEVLFALVKGLGYAPSGDVATTVSAYEDIDVFLNWKIGAEEAQNAIAAANEKTMVVNYPDTTRLNLFRPATRAEVAAMVYQGMVSAGQADPIQ